MMPLVLIVDDDAGIRDMLDIQLSDAGYRTEQARDGLEAMKCYRRERPDVMLTDLRMPYKDGQELLESVLSLDGDAVVILMTAYATVESAVEAMRAGAFDFLVKPFRERQVLAAIQRATDVAQLKRENQRLRHLVARDRGITVQSASERVRAVYSQAQTVADTDASVLILGETGTGKEHLAQAIHAGSPRVAAPWVVVNCGALPESLVETELFGHTRGAFTGAEKARPGRIRSADGGTLFLDEIGELPLSAQVKLLRFLQDGEIQAVGADKPVRVDVRVVAATNRDLAAMVRENTYREDLFYRLNVITLRLPPLRERAGDIANLAEEFLGEAAARHKRDPAQLTARVIRGLETYSWPGNVRQLKNMCERWAILHPGGKLAPEMIADDLAAGEDGAHQPLSLPPDGLDLAELEKSLIEQALGRSSGNKSAAARLLGISRHTLDYRLDKHGLGASP